tara:strand:- start:3953 stop:4561 length:609 start_codon:yes stop_codon:yes gene_type:complete
MPIKSSSRQSRSDATGQQILEATVECIYKYGYVGATLSVIAGHANVTRGALQHHFGNRRIDLMQEAAEYLYDIYFDQFVPLIGGSDPRQTLSNIWQLQKTLFKQRETKVLIEIWVACHSDGELAEKILPLFKKLDASLEEEWLSRFVPAGLAPDAIQQLRYLQRTMLRGAAVEHLISSDDKVFYELFDLADKMTASYFLNTK